LINCVWNFYSHTGVSAETILFLWFLVSRVELPFELQPNHLLWTLYFLKQYPTCELAANHWNCDVKTFRLYIWRVISILFNYLEVISLESRQIQTQISLVIDATECPIQRPSADIQRIFYSGKKKKHTIKYEIGVDVLHGFICWIAGAVPGSVHDITLSRTIGIVHYNHLLQPEERILADKGYIGESIFLTPIKGALNDMEHGWNSFINSHREIVEHTFARLKNFGCLSQKWRHDIDLHSIVFQLVCQIVNVDASFRPIHK